MMNCFWGMVDRRKTFSLFSSADHCQRSLPSRISDTPRAGFEPDENLSSGFLDWSCAVMITTTQRHHKTIKVPRGVAPTLQEELSNKQFYEIFQIFQTSTFIKISVTSLLSLFEFFWKVRLRHEFWWKVFRNFLMKNYIMVLNSKKKYFKIILPHAINLTKCVG